MADPALILVWTEQVGGRQLTFRKFRAGPEAVEEIQGEVARAAQLHVPTLVPPVEVRVLDGEVTIVSAAANGRTLRDLLQALVVSGEKLPASHATWIAIEVLKGLELAHAQDVFHGRLSPEHIVLTRTAEVQLTGFGLDAAARSLLRPETPIIAALAYVSPEQALGDPANAKSDLFALGSILFEALTGEPLFIEETFGKTFDAVGNELAPPLLDIRDELPRALDSAVSWALEKNAQRRCAEASALRRRLEAFQGILDAGDKVKPGEHPRRIAELLRLKERPQVDPAFDVSSGDNPFAQNALYEPTRVVPKTHARARAPATPPRKRSLVRTLLRLTLVTLLGALGVGVWAAWPRLEGPLRARLPPELVTRFGLTPVAVAEPMVPVAPEPAAPPDAGAADDAVPDAGVAEAPAPPRVPKPARLSIDSTPASDVSLDNQPLGRTPLVDVPVDAGTHTLELVCKKPKLKRTQSITLGEGETRALQIKLKRKP